MTERRWIFMLMSLLTIILSYEVFASRDVPFERLVLGDCSKPTCSGRYILGDRQLRFTASMERSGLRPGIQPGIQPGILLFSISTAEREHRGLIRLSDLHLVSFPGQPQLDAGERTLLQGFIDALVARQVSASPAPATLDSLIAALNHWVNLTPIGA